MTEEQKRDLMKMLAMRAMMEKDRDTDDEDDKDENEGPSGKTRKKFRLELVSVVEANALLKANHSGRMQKEIVACVTDPENNVRGSAAEFFNFTNDLLKLRSGLLAFEVCRYALTLYPHSVDLLANAIHAASNSGLFAEAEPYIETVLRIPRKWWKWQTYLFLAEFYEKYADCCEIEKMDYYLAKATKVVKEYKAAMPLDERAYNKEAELYLKTGQVNKARGCLEDAIFREVKVGNTYVKMVARQCCGTYLNEILAETGEYGKIIDVAHEAIKNTAQEQPSYNAGHAEYIMALARDALVASEHYKNRDDILQVLSDYQCAYDLNANEAFAKTIEERYAILCQKAKPAVTDRPLLKRKLYQEVGETEE